MATKTPESLYGDPKPYNWKDYLVTAGSSKRPFTRSPHSALEGFRKRRTSGPADAMRAAYTKRVKAIPGEEKASFDIADTELGEKFRHEDLKAKFAAARGGTYGGTAYLDAVRGLGRSHGLQRQQARADAAQYGQDVLGRTQAQFDPMLTMADTGRIGEAAPLSTFTPKSGVYPFEAVDPMIAGVGWPKLKKKAVPKKVAATPPEVTEGGGADPDHPGDSDMRAG